MSSKKGGWPRRDETYRLYRDRDGSYILIDVESRSGGTYEGLANVYEGASPSLGTTGISTGYFAENWPTRVEWGQLPEEWKAAFMGRFDEPLEPETIRGFWRVKNMGGCLDKEEAGAAV